MVIFLIGYSVLSAQSGLNHSPYEIFGTVSYNYSNANRQWTGEPTIFSYETQTVTFQPSGGYFITENIELLVDLRYTYYSTYSSDVNRTSTNHSISIDIGASYNYQVNPFLSAFIGTKVGLSWWRGSVFEDWYIYDPGWSKQQLSFPVFLAGGRFAIMKDCAVMMQIEYSKINVSYPITYWNIYNENVSLGFGFSVFL